VAGFCAWLRKYGGSSLRSLKVDGLPPASFYSSISSLTQLQDLTLKAYGDLAPFSLPDLSTLTRLSIETGGHHAQLPQRSLNLPRLKVLDLTGVLFNPCILDSMTQLQELEIDLFITDVADLVVDPISTVIPVEALLSGIGQLTQLTALWLRLNWDETDPPRTPPPRLRNAHRVNQA
jgi:hypothetical protein